MTTVARDTGRLIRVTTAGVRAAAVALVAATLFIGSTADGAQRAVQIVCFALGTASVLSWGLLSWEASRTGRSSSRFAVALFAVMATASLGCSGAHGGGLIAFALLAAAAAGATGALESVWWVAAVGVLAVVIGAIVTGADAVSTVGSCLEVVVALLLGHTRRAARIRTEQATQLMAQADRLREEQSRVATLDERARIAREIHDVLAHSLGALSIQIQAARALLGEQRDISQVLALLDRAQRLTADGLTETRRAVHALHTDARSLDQELAVLADDHRATNHNPVSVTVEGAPRPLRPETTLALLRAAQESLVNAAKHAPGQPVTVTLTFDHAHTQLRICNPVDDAEHTAARRRMRLQTVDSGYGLIGMRERLLLLQGSLHARAHAGCWEVTAQVPS